MAGLHFEFVSPENVLFSGDVDQVDLPGIEGDLGVLPGHAPMVTTLRPGVVTIIREGRRQAVVVIGGFAEMVRRIQFLERFFGGHAIDRDDDLISTQGQSRARPDTHTLKGMAAEKRPSRRVKQIAEEQRSTDAPDGPNRASEKRPRRERRLRRYLAGESGMRES